MTFVDTPMPFDSPALDRRPIVGSFTLLKTFRDVCEYQTYRRYILRDQKFVETPEMRWGNEVHSAFEHRIGRKVPLPEQMRQWEKYAEMFDKFKVLVEQKWGIDYRGRATGFFDKDVWFRGKADAVVLLDDKALITDFKTGSSKYEDPFELATNAMLLKAQFPQVNKVGARYAWLKDDRLGQMYDVSDFKGTFAEVERLMNLLEQKKFDGKWEKKKSGLCSWCSVSDCENWRERK